MAKAAAPATPATPAKSGRGFLVILVLVGLAAVGGGFFAPFLLMKTTHPASKGTAKKAKDTMPVLVPFDEVSVNLATVSQSRYLKVKIFLAVQAEDEKAVKEQVDKSKLHLRNWLITYLADRSMDDVRGTAGLNRIRREILEQFNAMLFPDGADKLVDVLFFDFLVQ